MQIPLWLLKHLHLTRDFSQCLEHIWTLSFVSAILYTVYFVHSHKLTNLFGLLSNLHRILKKCPRGCLQFSLFRTQLTIRTARAGGCGAIVRNLRQAKNIHISVEGHAYAFTDSYTVLNSKLDWTGGKLQTVEETVQTAWSQLGMQRYHWTSDSNTCKKVE